MPKIVDQESRRQHIADTAMRIIGTRGMEEATVRKIAVEAGVSAGAIQRCFATRDDLLRFTLRYTNIRFLNRVIARVTDPTDRVAGVRIVIDEMLPLDEERRVTSASGLALLAHSATDPAAADVMRDAYAGAHGFFAAEFGEQAAIALYALIVGLHGPLLVGAVTTERAWSIIEAELVRLRP